VRKSYKYRLYPNRAQTEALTEQLETHRRLYNAALEERKTAWEEEQRSVRYGEQSTAFKQARRENEFYARINFSSAQATLRKLNLAFEAFFRRVKASETPGYPRFKGRSRFRSVCYPSYGDGCKVRQDSEGRTRLYMQNVGEVKVKLHRPWEGDIKTVTVRREADRWFVVLSCDLGYVKVEPSRNPPVGIDLGLKAFYVTSDGETLDPPHYYRKAQKRLRRLQRTVSRRTKGSARWRKACRDVARLHWHVANQRRDFHFKAANALVSRYGAVYAEDLNIKGIARTRLAKSMHDVGWGSFLSILEYKAESAGVRFERVDPLYTTQTCSRCGTIPEKKLTLRDRMYSCTSCGFTADRDENAALNVLAKGLGCSPQSTSTPLGVLL
jgi:putative transposase